MKLPTSFIAVLFIFSMHGYAQEAAPDIAARSKEVVANLETKLKAIAIDFEAQRKNAQEEAVKQLQDLRKQIASEDLDKALEIREIERRIVDGTRSLGNEKSITKGKEKPVVEAKAKDRTKSSSGQVGLAEKLIGRSYRIEMPSGVRTWTFRADGVILKNGKDEGKKWVAVGNDAVVCPGYDTGNIELCEFPKDGAEIKLIYVGNYKTSTSHHHGVLLPK